MKRFLHLLIGLWSFHSAFSLPRMHFQSEKADPRNPEKDAFLRLGNYPSGRNEKLMNRVPRSRKPQPAASPINLSQELANTSDSPQTLLRIPRESGTESFLKPHSAISNEPLTTPRLCSIHGLWLSHIAGVSIELFPFKYDTHVEIRTQILRFPDESVKGILSPQWTGRGILSPESPTTFTIIFQEHVENLDEIMSLPKTVVFAGQCVICEGSPILQGTWVVFTKSQACQSNDSSELSKIPDTMYPLH